MRARSATSSKVPAVIVGGSLNGLGVARSLSRAGGIPLYVVDTTRFCACGWSRLCELVVAGSLEGPPLVAALLGLAARIAPAGLRPVLILTDDRAVATVSAERARLSPWFRICLPEAATVERLLDKSAFQRFAEERGLPVPRAALIGKPEDLERLGGLEPPLALKPADKAQSLNGKVERAARAGTREEARSLAARMLARGGALVAQEWVEGPDTEIYFSLFACDGEGRLLAFFPGRKLVCDPPAVGITAVCAPAPEASAELERLTRELVSATAYRGLGSLELKRDARTGRLVIIEPTVGRTDWQEESATLCGVNLPLLLYRAETGAEARTGVRTLAGAVAWRSSLRFRPAPGALPPGTRLRGGYFAAGDPGPAAYYYFNWLGLGVLRRARRKLSGLARTLSRQETTKQETTI